MSSCSSSIRDEDCKNLNWKEQGSRDAARGLSLSMFETHQKICLQGASFQKEIKLYKLGYQQGQKKYCHYRIGKLLGVSGSPINPSCDQVKFPLYYKGYEEGAKESKKKALQRKGL
jgi:hypothetical protein